VAAAVSMTEGADAVVLVVGLTSEGSDAPDEAEGLDRTSLIMPLGQDSLISSVAAAAAKKKLPVVVVVMSGGPVDLSAAESDPNVGAIVWCGYPGQSGGAAIADALFGVTNPSAKLTMTWYPESLSKEVGIKDMGMRPNATTGNPGRSHRFYTGDAVYKFGHGLSYTTFSTTVVDAPRTINGSIFGDDLRLSPLSKRNASTVSVEVANQGQRAGAEIVLLFAAPPDAGVGGRPLQSLIAFERVALRRGESKVVKLPIEAHHFTLADHLGVRFVPTGDWTFWVGVNGKAGASTVTVG